MDVQAFEFGQDFVRRYYPRTLALPDPIDQYFSSRGITPAMLADCQPLRLTPFPDADECREYAAYMHAPRCDANGNPRTSLVGLVWRHPIDEAKWGKFGRERIIIPTPEFVQYCAAQNEPVRKCTSPSKDKVPATSHLFVLPRSQELIRKSATIVLTTEGEGKLCVLEDMTRTISTPEKTYAAIGIDGVEQLICSPEASDISWKNRTVIQMYDADSARKPEVGYAELKAAAFYLSRGARAVYSTVWNEKQGKGLDDFLQFYAPFGERTRRDKFRQLLDRMVPTFRKYAPTDEQEGLPLLTYCQAFAHVPNLGHYKPLLLEELVKIFKKQGYKPKDIKALFDEEVEHVEKRKQTEQIEEQAVKIRDLFKIGYTPEMPDNFYSKNGYLNLFDTPLCSMFVIQKYIATNDRDKRDYYLLTFKNGREIELPSDKFTNYRYIAQVFNQNKEVLHDMSAKHIQRYIAEFYHRNRHKPIPVVQRHLNTGWEGSQFRLPTLDADDEYTPDIKERFYAKGDPDLEEAYMAEFFRQHNAAVFLVWGLCAPLISRIGMQNCSILISGDPGGGKTTAAKLALSPYGDWEKLKFTMNNTAAGSELICSMFRDLPVLMDEGNTGGSGDGVKMAAAFISLIYGWESSLGKGRSTSDITLRNMNEYKGLLFLSSERSLQGIMSVTKNMNVGGVYRRVLEVPAIAWNTLWSYDRSREKAFFDDIHDKIGDHFGHFGAKWLRHISDEFTFHQIQRRYKEELDAFGQKWALKGMDNLVCLTYAVIPDIETLLGMQSGAIRQRVQPFLDLVLAYNQRQIAYQIQNNVGRFFDCVDNFLSQFPRAFDGLCQKEELTAPYYGKYEGPNLNAGRIQTDIWLRPSAMDLICNEYGLNKNGILDQLATENKIELADEKFTGPDGLVQTRKSDLAQKWFLGKNWKVYHLVQNAPTKKEVEINALIKEGGTDTIQTMLTPAEWEQYTTVGGVVNPSSEAGHWLAKLKSIAGS